MGYTQYKTTNIQLYKVYIGLIVNTIFPTKNASVHLYNLPATECEITAPNEKRQASWAGPMRFVDERVTPTTLSLPRYAHWPNYYTTLDFQHVIIFYRGAFGYKFIGPPTMYKQKKIPLLPQAIQEYQLRALRDLKSAGKETI